MIYTWIQNVWQLPEFCIDDVKYISVEFFNFYSMFGPI